MYKSDYLWSKPLATQLLIVSSQTLYFLFLSPSIEQVTDTPSSSTPK